MHGRTGRDRESRTDTQKQTHRRTDTDLATVQTQPQPQMTQMQTHTAVVNPNRAARAARLASSSAERARDGADPNRSARFLRRASSAALPLPLVVVVDGAGFLLGAVTMPKRAARAARLAASLLGSTASAGAASATAATATGGAKVLVRTSVEASVEGGAGADAEGAEVASTAGVGAPAAPSGASTALTLGESSSVVFGGASFEAAWPSGWLSTAGAGADGAAVPPIASSSSAASSADTRAAFLSPLVGRPRSDSSARNSATFIFRGLSAESAMVPATVVCHPHFGLDGWVYAPTQNIFAL